MTTDLVANKAGTGRGHQGRAGLGGRYICLWRRSRLSSDPGDNVQNRSSPSHAGLWAVVPLESPERRFETGIARGAAVEKGKGTREGVSLGGSRAGSRA